MNNVDFQLTIEECLEKNKMRIWLKAYTQVMDKQIGKARRNRAVSRYDNENTDR